MGAGGVEKKRTYSESYPVRIREEDGVFKVDMIAPFGGKMKAELSGDNEHKALRITQVLRPGGADDAAVYRMLIEFLQGVEKELDGQAMKLGQIEIPVNGNQDLAHLFFLKDIGAILGEEEVAAAKELYNPRPAETPKRRAGERPADIVLSLEEITEGLKAYEREIGSGA